jgi:hypothetical protein
MQHAFGNHATGLLLQARLTVGPAGDKYEQEADRTAQQVMRALAAPAAGRQDAAVEAQPDALAAVRRSSLLSIRNRIQSTFLGQPGALTSDAPARPAAEGVSRIQRDEVKDEQPHTAPGHGMAGGPVDAGVAHTIERARGGGQPLDDGLRASMEHGFGADFSAVRVHTGSQADMLNRSLNARAFTAGSDVFFRSGEYNPASRTGQQLIAHELTHTVQQGAAGVQRRSDFIQRGFRDWWRSKFGKKEVQGRQRGSMIGDQVTQDEMPEQVEMNEEVATARLATDKGGEGDVGHAWVELRYDQEKAATYAPLINRLPIMPYGKQRLAAGLHDSWGFYPRMYTKNMANQRIMEKRGEVGATPGKGKSSREGDTGLRQLGHFIKNPAKTGADDGRKKYIWASVRTEGRVEEPDDDHIASARMKYRVTQKQIENMTRYIDSKSSATYSPYRLNCTSFAVEALKAAGQSPPSGTFFGFSYPKALHDLIATQKEKRNPDAFVRSGQNLFGGLMGQKDTKDPEAWEGVNFN